MMRIDVVCCLGEIPLTEYLLEFFKLLFITNKRYYTNIFGPRDHCETRTKEFWLYSRFNIVPNHFPQLTPYKTINYKLVANVNVLLVLYILLFIVFYFFCC